MLRVWRLIKALVTPAGLRRIAYYVRLTCRNPSLLYRPPESLLVLGHMRSYSSLLCHILGSHPEIDGSFESHNVYSGPRFLDLYRLRCFVHTTLGRKLRGRFVLDKILVPYEVPRELLNSSKVIILVRRPEETLASLLRLYRKQHKDVGQALQESANYYREKMLRLTDLACYLGPRAFFLPAEQLIESTDQTLEELRRFLGLKAPLTERYELTPVSGLSGYGDPSKWILSGQIRRQRSEERIEIPLPFLSPCQEAYEEAMKTLALCTGTQ